MSLPFLYTPESTPIWKTLGANVELVTLSSGESVPVFVKKIFGFSHAQLFLHGLPAVLPIEQAAIAELFDKLARKYSRVTLVDFENHLAVVPTGWNRATSMTHLVDLSPAYEPPDPDLRSEIRKSQREGLVIRKVSTHEEIEVSRMLFLLQGKQPYQLYPQELLFALAEASLTHDDIIWLIALHDGKLIASQVFLRIDSTLLYWLSVMDRKAAALKPAVALLKEGIQLGIKQGATRCNLGASPPEASGLVEFKKRWGAREHQYSIYSRKPIWWLR